MCSDEFDLLLISTQCRVLTAQATVEAAPGDPEALLELRRANAELAGLMESRRRATAA